MLVDGGRSVAFSGSKSGQCVHNSYQFHLVYHSNRMNESGAVQSPLGASALFGLGCGCVTFNPKMCPSIQPTE